MYDAGNRKDVRRAEKASHLAEAQRREIIKGFMSVAPGRQWLHDLISECHIFNTPFTGEAESTAFNCGKQSIGLQLFGDVIAVCPDEYVLMMREANERSITADTRSSARRDRDDSGSDPEADIYDTGAGPDGSNEDKFN